MVIPVIPGLFLPFWVWERIREVYTRFTPLREARRRDIPTLYPPWEARRRNIPHYTPTLGG